MDWGTLLERHGYMGLWTKIRSLESFRHYYRRWPYDDFLSWWPLTGDPRDDIHLTPEENVLGNEQAKWYLSQLSSTERETWELVLKGYKPKDIARLLGKSGEAVRFAKHSGLKKLIKLVNMEK